MSSKALSYRQVGIRRNDYLNLTEEIAGIDFYAKSIIAFIGFQDENDL